MRRLPPNRRDPHRMRRLPPNTKRSPPNAGASTEYEEIPTECGGFHRIRRDPHRMRGLPPNTKRSPPNARAFTECEMLQSNSKGINTTHIYKVDIKSQRENVISAARDAHLFHFLCNLGKKSNSAVQSAVRPSARRHPREPDKQRLQLHEFVFMRDHIHLILTPAPLVSLEKAMQFIKGGFSYRAQKEMNVNGEIWQKGYKRTKDQRRP